MCPGEDCTKCISSGGYIWATWLPCQSIEVDTLSHMRHVPGVPSPPHWGIRPSASLQGRLCEAVLFSELCDGHNHLHVIASRWWGGSCLSEDCTKCISSGRNDLSPMVLRKSYTSVKIVQGASLQVGMTLTKQQFYAYGGWVPFISWVDKGRGYWSCLSSG